MHKVLLIGAGSICRTHIDAFEGLHGRAKVVGIVARHRESARRPSTTPIWMPKPTPITSRPLQSPAATSYRS